MVLFSVTPHNLIAVHSPAEALLYYGLGALIGGSLGATAVVLDRLNNR